MAKATQFLKITDKNRQMVRGESFDEEHLQEIDLTGWSWDVQDPRVESTSPKGGTGESAAKSRGTKIQDTKLKGQGESDSRPKPNILSVQKSTDSATTRLLLAMDKGEIFPTAVLTIEERYQESPNRFRMVVELTDVFIVNFKWRAGAESAGMTFSEDWDLNYSRIHFQYDWHGKNDKGEYQSGGVIDQIFDRPPDDSESTSRKAPLNSAEKRDVNDAQIEDYLKRNPQLIADSVKKNQRGR
ncbi:MAG TPA: type VI secretion system tube protein Hcp [Polyangia bacterium]